MQPIYIGTFVRINGISASPFQGKSGVVSAIERDEKHRDDWDMCAVVIESRYTCYFPAFALDPFVDDWHQVRAA